MPELWMSKLHPKHLQLCILCIKQVLQCIVLDTVVTKKSHFLIQCAQVPGILTFGPIVSAPVTRHAIAIVVA